jgi:hypothetical protein
MVQLVDHGDVSVDFHGISIEEGGFVTPLPDGVESGLIKQRVALNELERTNGAVGGDDGVKLDGSFAAHLARKRGINGFDAVNEHGGIEMAEVENGRRWRARNRGLRIVVAEEANAFAAFDSGVRGKIDGDGITGVPGIMSRARSHGNHRGTAEAEVESARWDRA